MFYIVDKGLTIADDLFQYLRSIECRMHSVHIIAVFESLVLRCVRILEVLEAVKHN